MPHEQLLPRAVDECPLFRFNSSRVGPCLPLAMTPRVSMLTSTDEVWKVGSLLATPGIDHLNLPPSGQTRAKLGTP